MAACVMGVVGIYLPKHEDRLPQVTEETDLTEGATGHPDSDYIRIFRAGPGSLGVPVTTPFIPKSPGESYVCMCGALGDTAAQAARARSLLGRDTLPGFDAFYAVPHARTVSHVHELLTSVSPLHLGAASSGASGRVRMRHRVQQPTVGGETLFSWNLREESPSSSP